MDNKKAFLLIVALCFAVGFGSAYAVVPIYKRSVAVQGEFAYTGNVDFVGVVLVNNTAINVTLSVKVAKVYDVSLTVGGVVYTKAGNSWGVGVHWLVFDGLVLAVPFKADLLVVEP